MKKVAFNTGAFYTSHGQRIAVVEVNDGAIFIDFDRGIQGFMPLPRPEALSAREMASIVYRLYMLGQYGSGFEQGHYTTMGQISVNGYDAFTSDSDVQVVTRVET